MENIDFTTIFKDWTNGCIAVNNFEIKELFDIIPIGTKIIINP